MAKSTQPSFSPEQWPNLGLASVLFQSDFINALYGQWQGNRKKPWAGPGPHVGTLTLMAIWVKKRKGRTSFIGPVHSVSKLYSLAA